MKIQEILTELKTGKISAIQAQLKLDLWKPVELDGITYNPILTPQHRIKSFLRQLEESTNQFPQLDIALRIAKTWFSDEIEVINTAKL